jgi:hypothetical protein
MGSITHINVRNSERGTMAKCPQRWWWSWRDGLQPKETPKPLWFGTAIHAALAHYYAPGFKRRSDFIDKFRESADMEAEYIRTHVGGLDEDVWVEARTLGEEMLTNYVKEYDGDRDWDVIATEQTFELDIPFFGGNDFDSPLAKKITKRYGDTFTLNGTFDGVYRSKVDKKVRLMEHKTAASISVGHLPMDNQAGTYWMVAQSVGRTQGWLGPKANISEITYNFLRKALPDTRPRDAHGYATNKPGKNAFIAALEAAGHEFEVTRTGTTRYPTIAVMEEMAADRGLRVLGERSKVQPPPLFERHMVKRSPAQRRSQLRRLQDEVYLQVAYREGWLNLLKSPSRDTCPMCPFKEMCELHEAGSDWEGYRDAMFRSNDPYADHRKSAGSV